MKKVLLWLIVSLMSISMIAAFSLTGCKEAVEEAALAEEGVVEEAPAEEVTEEEAAPAEKITIGYSMPFIEDSPYCFPFFKYLEKSAKKMGWEIIITDAKGDIHTQSSQIEDLVAKGLDGLMIMPTDAAGVVSIIQKVYKDTGGELPIICSNVMPDPAELEELTAFAGPNSYLEGREMGKFYANYLEEKGIEKINMTESTGTAGYSAAIDRQNGFWDQVEEMGVTDKFNLLDRQPCDWSPDKAQTQTENWLTTFGEELQMIYSHNDGMGIGICRAFQDAGLEPGQVLTNGCDGQIEAVTLVKEGWMMFTVWQSPEVDAAIAMETMEKILAGEEVPYFNYMETPIVHAGNVDDYIDEAERIWTMLK